MNSLLHAMTIKTKVRLVFGLIFLTLAALGLISVLELGTIAATTANIRAARMPSTEALTGMREQLNKIRILTAEYLLSTSPKELDRLEPLIADRQMRERDLGAQYEKLIQSGAEKQLYSEFTATLADYISTGAKLRELVRAGSDEKALKSYQAEGAQSFAAADEKLGELLKVNADAGNIAASDSEAVARSTEELMLGAIGAALVLCAIGTLFVSRSVVAPITELTSTMERLSAHDYHLTLHGAERMDEIGTMVRAVGVFKDNMVRADELAARERETLAEREKRHQRREERIASFSGTVARELDRLSQAAAQMRAASQEMSSTASETSQQASAVDTAAKQTSDNVDMVAGATSELAASVAEIASQADQSRRVAGQAVSDADQTNLTVQAMADAAQRIGHITKLIGDIASQTNLLALNATIEAARAGDAGKGFAVVASEVKSLANQTAKATDDIAVQIGAMQQATDEAVDAISGIGTTISQIRDIATAISAAVEQQGATTLSIKSNTEEVARSTSGVASNISHLNNGASRTGETAQRVLDAATQLDGQAELLRSEIMQFLDGLRAA
jgi:methyl-accepting chemotaxis protein